MQPLVICSPVIASHTCTRSKTAAQHGHALIQSSYGKAHMHMLRHARQAHCCSQTQSCVDVGLEAFALKRAGGELLQPLAEPVACAVALLAGAPEVLQVCLPQVLPASAGQHLSEPNTSTHCPL